MLDPSVLAAHLRRFCFPPSWTLIAAADTGTFMSGAILAIDGDALEAIVLAEFPNYRYVGGEIELLNISNREWSGAFTSAWKILRPGKKLRAWADPNTQFRAELRHDGVNLMPNARGPELRTEIAREYFQANRIRLAPYLTILPYELEHATWPEQETSAGRFTRLKKNDHTLDCMEHALSRFPRSKRLKALAEKKKSFVDAYLARYAHLRGGQRVPDTHLGRQ